VPQAAIEHDGNSWLLHNWLRQLTGETSVAELARRMGRSRSSLSRWLSGTGLPRLPEFLAFVDAATGRAQDLVAELVPIEQVPALRARYEAARAARLMAFEQPWTEAILRAVETTSYLQARAHDATELSRLLDLPEALIDESLSLLHRAGAVELRNDKYQVVGELNVDTRGGKQALHTLKSHWARVAADRALAPHPGDLFGYNVFAVTSDDLLKIRHILQTTFREIRGIVATSVECERVALVNLQLMAWE
jgi:transcriptional regulator with XRE-family HTH domain